MLLLLGCDKEPQVKGNIVKSSMVTRGRKELKEPGKWDDCDWIINNCYYY